MPIRRMLGKRGNTTIPQEIRQAAGWKYNDVLSFTWDGCDSVIVKKEKFCDNCAGKQKENKERATAQALMEQMSPEFRKAALEFLLAKGSGSG